MLERPESWDTCKGLLKTQHGNCLRERSVLQSAKPIGVESLSSTFTSDMKMQSLVGFILALVQCFLTMPPFLSFEMGMYIPCHCMLEVSDILFKLVL